MEIVLAYLDDRKNVLKEPVRNFYKYLIEVLEEMVLFIYNYLPDFFDYNQPVVLSKAHQARTNFTREIAPLRLLMESGSLDRSLFRLAMRPFRQFIDENEKISYSQLQYLSELMMAYKELLVIDEGTDINYELHLILIQQNFNFPRYVLHFSYWLDAQLTSIDDIANRLNRLSKCIKDIEQATSKTGLELMINQPPLKEQLFESIINNYNYLLFEEKSSNHEAVAQLKELQTRRKVKIQLSVSVPVLALFLKLLYKMGIILNENKSDVFRIISDNFSTTKSEQPSYGSVKRRFNKVSLSAYLFLRNSFGKMDYFLREMLKSSSV